MSQYFKLTLMDLPDSDGISRVTLSIYDFGHMCTTEIYLSPKVAEELAETFKDFPASTSDVRHFEIGSENPEERWYLHLKLTLKTVGSTGRCAIHIRCSNNSEFPYGRISEFCLITQASFIDELASGIRSFLNFDFHEMVWDGQRATMSNDTDSTGD